MEQYKGADFGELSPHVFAVADASYRAMINEGKSNSILASGESGAGKTETTKMLMKNLAYLGGRTGVEGRTVEQQVLESNPVLEAFGNAKTVRNNNSSRFGKFVEIQFDKNGKISGEAIRTYLLERSHVCQVSDPERNYHCFYLLCSAPAEVREKLVREKYKLESPQKYHYLNQTNCYKLDAIDDAAEYLATIRAMDVVGISEEDQSKFFFMRQFYEWLLQYYILGIPSLQKERRLTLLLLRMKSPDIILTQLPSSLGVMSRVWKMRTINRDALAKTIYSRLFDWLVGTINVSIGQDPQSKSIIGVLDIYGSESFKLNSSVSILQMKSCSNTLTTSKSTGAT